MRITTASLLLFITTTINPYVADAFVVVRNNNLMQKGRRNVNFSATNTIRQQQQLYASSTTSTSSTSSDDEEEYDDGEEYDEGEEFDDLMLDNNSMMERAKIAFDNIDRDKSGSIDFDELDDLLTYLEIDATMEERRALFAYLDLDGDGDISLEEFLSWYRNAVEAATMRSQDFQSLLMSRRTVNSFDPTPISDDVVRRAIECAIAAPNRSQSEPWRFIKLGPQTVEKLQELNQSLEDFDGVQQQTAPLLPDVWTEIPGWCVVTSKRNLDDDDEELKDFRSTSCAMQNFMLSMWSEGVGSKWTEGPTQKTQQFADIIGIDTSVDKVAGIIWFGFSKSGGLSNAEPKQQREKGVDDVLSTLP
eukprot:CAMPEP_0194132322 /NCGR_PEP_ID=MMETSP0152-20130528/2818_1 /TAXON_ID=1049557 /ORGANISM="Thalassiothrix antarctica, Strain L6-D1" /LENGTH=360 /DNA_ID=CAMNT_0038827337 /DNA_START=49 /DNA_END=1131 /DNA_ORIENTATION=+